MQLYDCTVRHAGNLLHEIPRYGVTAPEIMILRTIHGGDAVVKIQPRKNDRRAHSVEIARLKAEYGKHYSTTFGDGYIEKLPQKLDSIDVSEEETEEETEAA